MSWDGLGLARRQLECGSADMDPGLAARDRNPYRNTVINLQVSMFCWIKTTSLKRWSCTCARHEGM